MLGRLMTLTSSGNINTFQFFTFTTRSVFASTQTSSSFSALCQAQSAKQTFVTYSKKRPHPLKENIPVVLLEDIPRGLKGEVIQVPKGYARNFLLPTKKAVVATRENVQQHSIPVTVRFVCMSLYPLSFFLSHNLFLP
jgi:uncharacterized protein YbaR (Trm112 family)